MSRRVRLWAALVVTVPALSLGCGMLFSQLYWGFPWALPPLDERVHGISWASVASFASDEDGTHWRLLSPEALSHVRRTPAEDDECCVTGRILDVIETQAQAAGREIPPPSPDELASAEESLLRRYALASGEPRYPYSRRLLGVVAFGATRAGEPVAFSAFTGGEVSNDHYAMDEVLLGLGPGGEVLSARRTFGDVAGIEGATAPRVAVATFLVMSFAASLLALAGGLVARGRHPR